MDWKKLYQTGHELGAEKTSLQGNLEKVEFEERYFSREFLNEGAMKRIYKCKDLCTGREVAYATPKSTELAMVESFLREANISAALQHPNIIPVYDIGLNDGTPYFVMKMIYGTNLDDILFHQKKNLGLNTLVNLFTKVCEAISYTHSKGIIHLDLKPDNIQISEYGEVLICDWGLAKIVDWEQAEHDSFLNDEAFYKADTLQSTLFGFIKGTPGFLSPEQAQGSSTKKSYASDIYSLGAILYAILTKKTPIQGDNLEEIVANTIAGKIEAPRSIDKKIPSSLEAICLKALQTKEEDRYASVKDLIHDIELYQSGFAPKAEKLSLVKQVQLYINRNSLLAASIGIYLSTIGLFSIVGNVKLSDVNNKLRSEQAVTENQALSLQRQNEALEEQNVLLEKQKAEIASKKQELEVIAELASPEAYNKAFDYWQSYDIPRSKYYSDMAHRLDPSSLLALELQLFASAASLDPMTAQNAYNKISKYNTSGYKEFQNFNLTEQSSPQEVLNFVKAIHNKFDWRLPIYLPYTYNKLTPHSEDKMKMLRELLALHHRGSIQNFKWSLINEFYSFDLSHNPRLRALYPLSGLKVRTIDVSYSNNVIIRKCFCPDLELMNIAHSTLRNDAIFDLQSKYFPNLTTLILDHNTLEDRHLRDLQYTSVEILSIRHSKIKDYRFLKKMNQLKSIIIDTIPKNFPNSQLGKIVLSP